MVGRWQWRTNVNHNYHDDLFYSPQLPFENARRDTGAKLLQDLFAEARRIEIKAIINVFSVHMHREKESSFKHRNGFLLQVS